MGAKCPLHPSPSQVRNLVVVDDDVVVVVVCVILLRFAGRRVRLPTGAWAYPQGMPCKPRSTPPSAFRPPAGLATGEALAPRAHGGLDALRGASGKVV